MIYREQARVRTRHNVAGDGASTTGSACALQPTSASRDGRPGTQNTLNTFPTLHLSPAHVSIWIVPRKLQRIPTNAGSPGTVRLLGTQRKHSLCIRTPLPSPESQAHSRSLADIWTHSYP